MRGHLIVFTAIIALAPGLASAQETVTPAPFGATEPIGGWTFTPSLGFSSVWDDNPLIQGKGSDITGDLVSVVTPHADLGYYSSRNALSASYNGAFEAYRQFDSLNNYGQVETLLARHKTTPRTSFFVQQQFSLTPTTEVPLLVGVPFVRIGARVAEVKGGVDHAFTKRTTIEAAYNFQWIAFDKDPTLGQQLIGGTGHDGTVTLKHQTTTRTTLVADYEIQHALIIDGSTFTVESARVGGEHRFSTNFSASAEAGFSHVSQTAFGTNQTSPSVRASISRRFERFEMDASYGRAFVPAFGVGNTLESQDVDAHVRTVFTHRLYAEAALSRRTDSPLTGATNPLDESTLQSLWFSTLVGYTASPWLRIEGFFATTHQQNARPGGQLEGDRVGIQVTTIKPMRVH